MKPPPDSSTLQPVSSVNPARPNGAKPNAVSLTNAASVALGSPLKTAQAPRDLPASLSPLPAKQGSVIKTDVALRVSVIDGADRMVYSDVRDRKGWVQPLAVNEALRDAGQRSGGRDVPASPQPRVVRELEVRATGARSEPVSAQPSPHQVGKANVQSRALNASSRVETRMPKKLTVTHQPSAVTRSR